MRAAPILQSRNPSLHHRRSIGPAICREVQVPYILAAFLPPLALLLNGQIFSAVLNAALIVPCFIFGFIFPVLWLVPSLHGVVAIYMKREDRKHQEVVDAIRRHGPPPGYKP
jgi:hypothetical protein